MLRWIGHTFLLSIKWAMLTKDQPSLSCLPQPLRQSHSAIRSQHYPRLALWAIFPFCIADTSIYGPQFSTLDLAVGISKLLVYRRNLSRISSHSDVGLADTGIQMLPV